MKRDPLAAVDLAGFLRDSRGRFGRGVGLALLRSLVVAPCPLLFQRIIDRDVPQGNSRLVALHAVLFVGLLGVHWVFSLTGADRIARAMAQLMVELRSRIFFRLQFLSFSYLDRQQTGRLLAKYAFDTQRIETVLYSVLNQFLPNLLYSGSVFIVLAVLNWRLALVIALCLPIWGIAKWRFFVRLQTTNRAARLAEESLAGKAGEYISALRLLRSLGEEDQAERILERTSGAAALQRVQQSWVNTLFGTFAYVSTQVIALCVVAGGAELVITGHMTLGVLFAFVSALPVLLSPIQSVIALSEPWFAGRESYLSIKELVDSPYVEHWVGERRADRLSGSVQFENVTFRYHGAERPALRELSLSIRAGEHLALVGGSGSGKSTLVNLLLGLYAPDSGRILLDGTPQADWDMRWIRRQLAIVMQDTILLSGTIADNIRFAQPGASDDEVRAAAQIANADEFIAQIAGGYEAVVGERGSMLSGGQRQRIAIARAVLRNPPMLILDEATSALDFASERLVRAALDRVSAGRTVITIAHRLSTIRKADRVVMMREGQIAEQGTYAELIARGGAFARLAAPSNQDFDHRPS